MTAAAWRVRALALLLIILSALSCSWLWDMARAETYYNAVSTELSFWRRQGYQPQVERVEATAASLALALELVPKDPRYLQAGAELMRWRARWSDEPNTASDYFQQSLQLQWQALSLRPGHLADWRRFLGDKARAGAFDEQWQLARQQILALDRSR